MSGGDNCILMVGGYGAVGREAAKTIRRTGRRGASLQAIVSAANRVLNIKAGKA